MEMEIAEAHRLKNDKIKGDFMAIPSDIRIEISFSENKKRRQLNRLLNLKKSGTDYLIDLWIYAALNNPDGILKGWTDEDLADAAKWESDPKVFEKAVLKKGFVDVLPEGGYKIHDWAEHQPFVIDIKKRSAIAANAAKTRWNREKGLCSEHAPSMPGAMLKPKVSNAKTESEQCP